jgi:hypothetical protein
MKGATATPLVLDSPGATGAGVPSKRWPQKRQISAVPWTRSAHCGQVLVPSSFIVGSSVTPPPPLMPLKY